MATLNDGHASTVRCVGAHEEALPVQVPSPPLSWRSLRRASHAQFNRAPVRNFQPELTDGRLGSPRAGVVGPNCIPLFSASPLALDLNLRRQMQDELVGLQRRP